jgi:hypothetical protein
LVNQIIIMQWDDKKSEEMEQSYDAHHIIWCYKSEVLMASLNKP